MEKLSINNFGGLKSVELEIRPVTGFIGPEGSGKSVIAKLLYFFRQIASRLPTAIRYQESPQYKVECRKRFNRYFPIENTGIGDFEITYSNNKEWVRVTFAARKDAGMPSLDLEWSSIYDMMLEKIAHPRDKMPALGDNVTELTTRILAFREEVEPDMVRALGTRAIFDQIFIPAGRAFFSQVQNTVFTQFAEGESPEPFMAEFGALLEQSKSILDSVGLFNVTSGEMSVPHALGPSFDEILHARLLRIRNQDFLEFADGRRVKLAQASSGQQEALPLLLLLASLMLPGNWRGRVLYIEEPEAHLFPSTQKLIMESMVKFFRAWGGRMGLVLTTHSPYILTSINNLLQAGKLYAAATKKEADRLARIIPVTRTFNPDEVGFYALENGNAKSIMDPQMGLIDADIIDQVSNDIAIQFDQLLSEGNEKS